MRAACIDIGSNTTRLLVAELTGNALTEIHQDRVFTRIGQRMGPGGEIGADTIADVVQVVARQLGLAAELGAEEVRGVATAAIRRAANGAELLEAITAATGLAVVIISGEEEARLAFRGAAAGHVSDGAAPGSARLGVIDVGGGSSEIVVGAAPGRVDWWASVELGSSMLTSAHLRSDPPTPAELSGARAAVGVALAGLAPPQPSLALAVGGSATSLGRLTGPVLDDEVFDRTLAVLAAEPAAVVAERFAIDPLRARLLPAGLLILQGGAALLKAPLEVGRGGIREGVLLEALRA